MIYDVLQSIKAEVAKLHGKLIGHVGLRMRRAAALHRVILPAARLP
jgi:hypothetical protein